MNEAMGDPPRSRADVPGVDSDERLRLALMAIRQFAYGLGDELGRIYGLSRPCKTCEQARRHPGPAVKPLRERDQAA